LRENIYYWKCDNPLSLEGKKNLYFKDKYDRSDLVDRVKEACASALNVSARSIKPLDVDGNHFAFIIEDENGHAYFFRADDGGTDDDYLIAETAFIDLAAQHGVPVPRVFHTDITQKHGPFRFQIMEYLRDPSLSEHHQRGNLDLQAVAGRIGRHMRRLHTISLDGFGFADTDYLRSTGHIRGLDPTYPDYFHKQLDTHLGYLRQHGLISGKECDEIASQFARHAPRLDLKRGVLVHRDMAFWNIMGTPGRISAIIDWDDAVSGDPADDIGILGCFHNERFMDTLIKSYCGGEEPSREFRCRIRLHTLRNMLWKTKIRHSLGYFDKGNAFFLNTPDVKGSLKDHTVGVLRSALEKVRNYED
jgi:aminoglycoside phosphotransferase (APT) family kinase protein